MSRPTAICWPGCSSKSPAASIRTWARKAARQRAANAVDGRSDRCATVHEPAGRETGNAVMARLSLAALDSSDPSEPVQDDDRAKRLADLLLEVARYVD